MKTIETITDKEFNEFFEWLPARVKLLVRSGFVNWIKVLPEWYEKYILEKELI